VNRDDIVTVVSRALSECPPGAPVDDIVTFYLKARELSRSALLDGAQLRPQYSLRTLCRALSLAKVLMSMRHALVGALYEVGAPGSVWPLRASGVSTWYHCRVRACRACAQAF
jgi:midasin (ATPase involved in ribosome maturation)